MSRQTVSPAWARQGAVKNLIQIECILIFSFFSFKLLGRT